MTDQTITHSYGVYDKKYVIKIGEFLVNYKDVFSFSYLYKLMHEWLVEEGYAPREDEDFKEALYLQRINPAAGDEYWIRWRLTKTPYATKLWRYAIDIDFHAFTMKKAEFVLAGKKYEADKGEIELKVYAYLLIDPDKTLDKSAITKFLKPIIINNVLRKRKEDHRIALYKDLYRLQDAIKTYLKLETYLPEKELSEYWAKRPG